MDEGLATQLATAAMPNAPGLVNALVALLLGGAVSIIGIFTSRVIGDVEKLRDAHGRDAIDLANFKTEVANTYSKESSTQASLSRIHDRLDDFSKNVDGKMDNMQTDIKTLIREVRNK